VLTGADSFCRPSRGPTSTMRTEDCSNFNGQISKCNCRFNFKLPFNFKV
jgi:hypothetical protein